MLHIYPVLLLHLQIAKYKDFLKFYYLSTDKEMIEIHLPKN